MKNRSLFLTAANILIGILTAQASTLKIYLGNDFQTSSTKVIFSANATSGFDSKLDKEMKKIPENKMNYIYSLAGKKHMLFENYRPATENYSAISLQIAVEKSGSFTFFLEDANNDFDNRQFALCDLATGAVTTIYPGISRELSFSDEEINTRKNYTLYIFRTPTITTSPVSCNDSRNGTVSVFFSDTGKWEARLRTGPSTTVQSKGQAGQASFYDLSPGVYFVEIWKGKNKIYENIASVEHPALLKPEFSVATDTLSVGEQLFAENISSKGARWYWQFGDETDSKQFSPSHVYQAPGTYQLTLTIADEAGCTSSVTKQIFVEPGKTSTTVAR